MSQSPLAPSRARGRKSLTAFARPPSQLSRSTSVNDMASGPSTPSTPSPASSVTPSQNAFATPPRRDSGTSMSRHRHSMGGTPVQLTYSPFQTPPAGPSISTNTPFDFAANARQAKQAEDDKLRAATDAIPRVKKSRFIRRKALWRRALSSPGDLLDSAIFQLPSSVQEILPPERWANPLAMALYVVQWLLLAPLRPGKKIDDVLLLRKGSALDDRWNRYEEDTPRRGLVGWRTALLFTLILFALSAANAGYLFTRFRNYDMLLRGAEDPLPSPNASPTPAPRVKPETPQPTSEPETKPAAKYARTAAHITAITIKWLYHALLSAFGAAPPATSAPTSGNGDRIQSLRVWDPNEFCLAFFCAFPPSAPVIAHLLTAAHPLLLPFLHLATGAALTHLAAAFARLVKDRQVLYAEVQREYDQRFVYKRVFASTADRAVGTSDSLLGP